MIIVKLKKGTNINLSHLYGTREKLGSLWLMERGRTPMVHFTNKYIKQNVSIRNVAHPLRAWWKKTHCDTVGKGRLRMPGGGGPTHFLSARIGTTSAHIYSAFPFQRGRNSLQSAEGVPR